MKPKTQAHRRHPSQGHQEHQTLTLVPLHHTRTQCVGRVVFTVGQDAQGQQTQEPKSHHNHLQNPGSCWCEGCGLVQGGCNQLGVNFQATFSTAVGGGDGIP